MAQWIKQNTSITVKVGPFLDEVNGRTVEGALTITQPDIRLSKNGGAFAQKAAAQTLSHDENGYYGLLLDATDTGTLGRLTVHIHKSGALPVWYEFMVVSTNVWDSMFGADKLQVDAIEISSDASAADNLEVACNNYSVTRGLTGTALPNAAADANNGLVTGDGSVTMTAGVGNRPSVDATAISGGAAAADKLESACDNYGAARGLAGTALPNAAANAAGGVPISAAGGLALDTKLANTNEVTAARMGALTDWLDAGRLDVILDAIKAVTDNLPNSGALTTIGTDTARLTAVRAAVLTDWINGGRLDLLLDAIKTVTDNLPDAGALTTIGTDTARLTAARAVVLTDWINGGRLDLLLDAIPTTAMRGTDNAALASVCTEGRLAELAAANLPADVDNILADTNELQTDNVPGLIGALENLSAAAVNAEVVDVLKTDTVTLPGQEAPPVTPTMEEAVAWLYKVFRNKKTQNATDWKLYDDAGSTVDSKATVSADGTTATKAEVVTGP